MHLGKVHSAYDKIRELGAEVIAVTSDAPETLRQYKEKTGTRFPLLSDSSSAAVDLYGIRNNWELMKRGVAHPSTFIIDRQGIVRFAEIRRNYLVRIKVSTIIQELNSIRAGSGEAHGLRII